MSIPEPYYTAPGQGPVRRLLLLSHHFPPSAAAGAMRWQKLAALVAARGWSLDVVAGHPDDLPRRDEGRYADLPAGTRAWGARTRQPRIERVENALWGLVRRARGSRIAAAAAGDAPAPAAPAPESLTPDEMRWRGFDRRALKRAWHAWLGQHREAVYAGDVARLARGLAARQRYELVVSCGPPHGVHEAARQVAAAAEVPFVMDLRDPWSLERRIWEAYASPLWFTIARRREARCVSAAAAVVVNTDEVRDVMAARYPGRRVLTVMNGFDDAPQEEPPSPPFTITYAGAIYLDRDPRPLFKAVRSVVEELALAPSQLRVRLVGEVQDFGSVPTGALAEAEGIGPFVTLLERQPLAALRPLLAASAVLVSLPQDSAYAVPSKVFEYMPYRAWLLAMAAPGTPTARLLAGTEADVCAPDDVAGIAAVLRARYLAFSRGERASGARGYERFSRRWQAETLAAEFDRVLAAASGTAG